MNRRDIIPTTPAPTPAELRDEYIRSLRAELPDLRTGAGSLARAEAGTIAGLISGLYERLAAIERNITPYSADTPEGLAPHAETVRLPRKGATPARKSRALEIRGNPGSTIAAGSALRHSSGLRFQTTSTATIALGDDRVFADVEAIDVGPVTRLTAGEALVLQSPPAGVQQTAKLVLDLDEGGREAESLGAWRERVLAVWRQKRQGGNRSDYRQWALELPFVDEVYIYANRPGRGHVGIAALKEGTGTNRLLSAGERDELAQHIEARRPICDQVHILELRPVFVHGLLVITPFPGHERDWDGFAEVEAWDSRRGVLTLSTDPPPSLAIGDHLTIFQDQVRDDDLGTGRAAIVSHIDGREIGLASLAGSDPLGFTPNPGDPIAPSSRTHHAVWQDIVDHLAALGPANPDGRHGVWLADVMPGQLQARALSVPGVMTAQVAITGVEPGAGYPSHDHPFPDLAADLLLPGQWVIR